IGATLLTTLPLALAGMVAAPVLVPFAFGHAFSGAVAAAQVLVLGQAILGISHVLSEISRGLERPAVPAVTEGLGAIAAVVALPTVVPHFGLVGAAVATTTIYLAISLIMYFKLREDLTRSLAVR